MDEAISEMARVSAKNCEDILNRAKEKSYEEFIKRVRTELPNGFSLEDEKTRWLMFCLSLGTIADIFSKKPTWSMEEHMHERS